ncbi:MAG: hypothetical protein ABI175_29785, partial [Polyangiales bacterium]
VLVASATIVVAQPKKGGAKAPAKTPVAPAKTPAPTPAAGSGSGSAAPAAGSDAGSAVQMAEDPPPSDMEGTNEYPDAPKTGEGSGSAVVIAPVTKAAGYPIEESQRPITLPKNMSEVSINPHAQFRVDSGNAAGDKAFAGAMALRARYGITRQAQLGLTYLLGGAFDDPRTTEDKVAFHPGKAVGLDVTVLLQDWIAVRVGVPVYIDPVAVGLELGAPIKFILTDKLALGGMDDLLNIKIAKFAPSFYQEVENARNAANYQTNTSLSKGTLRFSAYGMYQYKPNLVFIGRFGVAFGDFSDTLHTGTAFIRAGFNFSPRKFLDVGLSLGWDDLSIAGGFAPAGYLAFRI